ncbi:M48 family peptidase [Paracoccus suum]|uniref:M48 family peptidase n=1 Tax=Paracoccus suum TaxID=2259340 RepID=A0A344PG99_9RHOB|nr:SprT family zinc-dependent metalloprotease [Paracoccus suum]AXC48404.1 M48 family peptidase [Paracoccus suum]
MGSITLATGQEVVVRRSARARRMILRVSRRDGQAVLTLPPGATEAEGARFVQSRADWLGRAVASMPAPAVVAHGARLPVDGTPLVITPAALRLPRIEGEALLVPAGREPGPVLAAWLRERARTVLEPACTAHARRLPSGVRKLTGISLRDTRSRWGSCTAQGKLMFNWRLAMAPPAVLDYVAAHEVAHLARMDHSPAFWAVVAHLCPEHEGSRAWLRRHGPALQAWRFRRD